MVYVALFLFFAVPAMAMIAYGRITDRLGAPNEQTEALPLASQKQELPEVVKPVHVSQPVQTPVMKASLSMVSDSVDWSQVAACVENKTNCVCYGHKAQRLAIVPETCQAAVKYGWITTKQL